MEADKEKYSHLVTSIKLEDIVRIGEDAEFVILRNKGGGWYLVSIRCLREAKITKIRGIRQKRNNEVTQ